MTKKREVVPVPQERHYLVAENMGLVHKIASDMTRHILKHSTKWGARKAQVYEDLAASGYIGLCLAATRFDPDRGFKFSTYAHACIKSFVLSEAKFSQPRSAALGSNDYLASQLVKNISELSAPDSEDMQDVFDWRRSENEYGDIPQQVIEKIKEVVGDRRWAIFQEHCLRSKTYDDISDNMGITRQAVHQQFTVCLRLLRASKSFNKLIADMMCVDRAGDTYDEASGVLRAIA